MTGKLVKVTGNSVAPRPTKQQGHALIASVLDEVYAPLQVAGQCRSELRGVLQKVRVGQRYYLPDAKFNHAKMLKRAALVSRTHAKLIPVAYPHIVRTPTITAEIALTMLTVLFGAVGKVKNVETSTLLKSCIAMFDPHSDIIGEATELWRPVSSHPAILALAVKKLTYTSVFTSAAELRDAMQEARSSVVGLINATDRWMELLRSSDRVLFEFDHAGWMQAYANVGTDVVGLMQDSEEAGDDDDEPASPRWSALETLRRAKLIE